MNGKLIAGVFGVLFAFGLIAALVGERSRQRVGEPERTAQNPVGTPVAPTPPADLPKTPKPAEVPTPRRRCGPEEWAAVKEAAEKYDRQARKDYDNKLKQLEQEYLAELQRSAEDPKRIHSPLGQPYEVDKFHAKLESHRRRNPESCQYVLRETKTTGLTHTGDAGAVVFRETAERHRAEELKVWLRTQSDDTHFTLYVRWQVIDVRTREVAAEWPDPLNPVLLGEGAGKKDEPAVDGASASTWVHRLADGTPAERRAAASALGQMNLDSAIPHLVVAMLKDPDPEVRARAARAAGRLGRGVRPATAELAAFRLGRQNGMRETGHPELLPALTTALSDPSSPVVHAALDGLEELGPAFLHRTDGLWRWNRGAVQETVRQLLSMTISSSDRRVRARAADVVSCFGPTLKFCRVDGVQVKAVVSLLSEKDRSNCCKVIRLVRDIGPAAREAVPYLIELSRDPDAAVASATAEALAAVAPRDEQTQVALVRVITEGVDPAAAGDALADCEVIADDIRAALVHCLKQGSSLHRCVVAAGVLVRTGELNDAMSAVLSKGLRSDKAEVVATAAAALRSGRPLPAEVLAELEAAFGRWKDAHGPAKLHLAVALYNRGVDDTTPRIGDVLRAAAESRDEGVRSDVARALAAFEGRRDPVYLLLWLLKDDSPLVRLTAA